MLGSSLRVFSVCSVKFKFKKEEVLNGCFHDVFVYGIFHAQNYGHYPDGDRCNWRLYSVNSTHLSSSPH